MKRRKLKTGGGLTAKLMKMADRKTWERAQDYVGAFYETRRVGNRISGHVVGQSGAYTTFLRLDAGDLDPRCSCPAAEDMVCCKHAVALGLTFEREPKTFRQTKKLS